MAQALAGVANKPYVFTKCGRMWDEKGQIGKRLKAASIRAECDASLKRLKVDDIDLYQMHWPEPDEDVEEGWQTMLKLKEEGKIRWAGVSNFSAAQMARAGKLGPITSLQPPYSLIRPEVEESILPYCLRAHYRRHRLFADGIGSLDRQDDARADRGHACRRLAEGEEPVLPGTDAVAQSGAGGGAEGIGSRHGKSPGEAAIAWVLRHPAVTAAIVGRASPGS